MLSGCRGYSSDKLWCGMAGWNPERSGHLVDVMDHLLEQFDRRHGRG